MEAQAIAALTGVLKCSGRMIWSVLQPEERLEIIHKWVDKWDVTWYIDEHKIIVPDLDGHHLMELSKQLAFEDDVMVTGAIAITDLQQPKGQRWFDVKDLFEDYQEREDELADNVDEDEDEGKGGPHVCWGAGVVLQTVQEHEVQVQVHSWGREKVKELWHHWSSRAISQMSQIDYDPNGGPHGTYDWLKSDKGVDWSWAKGMKWGNE
ncbi:hypothetical protein F5J12DRAFT_784218 [Pisolithus orientalis]|uniref:uncharacterized protein n=1 Tax=Pisolithus orientalis TaxID=936130 RepID=UPI002224DE6B|nr:uncharacterized protein F5J12DRAFT_784218 [Pisolithus orientalis]KAI6000969.1 hypothetical protein F5J12DRAFT_784218 [Pisolithus orientalis]